MWYEYEPLLTSSRLRSSTPSKVRRISSLAVESLISLIRISSPQRRFIRDITPTVTPAQLSTPGTPLSPPTRTQESDNTRLLIIDISKHLIWWIHFSWDCYINGMTDYDYSYHAQGFKKGWVVQSRINIRWIHKTDFVIFEIYVIIIKKNEMKYGL